MSSTLHATVTTDALTMAVKFRSLPIGLVHHSDRGVQYACHACRELLEEHGIVQSMRRAGNCYDNAMMESLWASLKKELVHDQRFSTHNDARTAIFEWIGCRTIELKFADHLAKSAPKRSRRPRGSDRTIVGVRDWRASPVFRAGCQMPPAL